MKGPTFFLVVLSITLSSAAIGVCEEAILLSRVSLVCEGLTEQPLSTFLPRGVMAEPVTEKTAKMNLWSNEDPWSKFLSITENCRGGFTPRFIQVIAG